MPRRPQSRKRSSGTVKPIVSSSLSMVSTWTAGAPGILSLPSGRLVRGRGLRRSLPAGVLPEFGVYLRRSRPEPVEWESRWIRWPDFWLPLDRGVAEEILRLAWRRAADERVEIACGGVMAGPAPRWPVWRCWTAWPLARRSLTYGRATTGRRWRRHGSTATSPRLEP